MVCTIDLTRYRLKAFLRDPGGELYGGFERLARSQEGRDLVFAMNAGMYDKDRLPVGLYVEGGHTFKQANTASGYGNFHLKPNGVSYVRDQTAGVLETRRYLASRPRAEIATQSGPMLVIDGRIHPKFSEDGSSRKLRNGVAYATAMSRSSPYRRLPSASGSSRISSRTRSAVRTRFSSTARCRASTRPRSIVPTGSPQWGRLSAPSSANEQPKGDREVSSGRLPC